MQKLLGLDIGKKTIGLALSDASLKIASPVKILYRTKFTPDMNSLLQLADQHSALGELVLGDRVALQREVADASDLGASLQPEPEENQD